MEEPWRLVTLEAYEKLKGDSYLGFTHHVEATSIILEGRQNLKTRLENS